MIPLIGEQQFTQQCGLPRATLSICLYWLFVQYLSRDDKPAYWGWNRKTRKHGAYLFVMYCNNCVFFMISHINQYKAGRQFCRAFGSRSFWFDENIRASESVVIALEMDNPRHVASRWWPEVLDEMKSVIIYDSFISERKFSSNGMPKEDVSITPTPVRICSRIGSKCYTY